jgi:fused signal recognition particle receptor
MSLFSFFSKKDDKHKTEQKAKTAPETHKEKAVSKAGDAPEAEDASKAADVHVVEDNQASYQKGLRKTRSSFWSGLKDLFQGSPVLSEACLDALETQLIMADIGRATVADIMKALEDATQSSKAPLDVDAAMHYLAELLTARLTAAPPTELKAGQGPHIILAVGINGAGKTTTLGKLAAHYQAAGHRVLLAAGDTFRAAAIEQLQGWGARLNVPVIAQQQGGDAASVLFDAVTAARARGVDVVLADTAGRLHNKAHLMEELKKIKRVLQKIDPGYPQETILVIDGTLGQNSLQQAAAFHEAIGVDKVIVTKLDGSAKGGVLFALQAALGLPIQYVGLGERAEDLRPFDPKAFVDALLDRSD